MSSLSFEDFVRELGVYMTHSWMASKGGADVVGVMIMPDAFGYRKQDHGIPEIFFSDRDQVASMVLDAVVSKAKQQQLLDAIAVILEQGRLPIVLMHGRRVELIDIALRDEAQASP